MPQAEDKAFGLTELEALNLLDSAKSHMDGHMIPLPKLREFARREFGSCDEASMNEACMRVFRRLVDNLIANGAKT